MARRRQDLPEILMALTSKLPWWVGVALATVAYVWLHSVASTEVTATARAGQIGQLVTQNVFMSLASVGQYVLPLVFLAGAGLSAFGRAKRKALHDQVAGSADRAALNDMSWQQFEALVGEVFRRKGYAVSETGGGGADGGVDLVLKKEGETSLVQCKQWRGTKVGVGIVRELYGVMAAKGATGGFVVSSGEFTNDAQDFVRGRNIKLVDSKGLHALIRGVSVPGKVVAHTPVTATVNAPSCPVCQGAMVERTAKRGTNSGNAFWGCSKYPGCKGTRPA